MAPKIELEADHLRDKARKDLLGLLEGVSKAAVVGLLIGHLAYLHSRYEARRTWSLERT
jgi:O-succinylbenzoate synthase